MTKRERRERMAREFAEALLDSNRFHRLVKEVVLRVLVERETINRIGAATSFLGECADKGIKVELVNGKLEFDRPEKLGAMTAVVALYREDIVRHLEKLKQAESF